MNQKVIHPPSQELFSLLDLAQRSVGEHFLGPSFRNYLQNLDSTSSLNAIESDTSHPLWWFLPPILYDLFDEKLTFDWLVQDDTSRDGLLVIPPPFDSIVDRLQGEVSGLGIETEISRRLFSQTFIGLLYGGYPWFESYCRIVQTKELLGQHCTILRATSTSCDVPETLDRFKRRKRNKFGQSLQMAFDDLPYPGVLRPFHIPARIETRRHILAAELSP